MTRLTCQTALALGAHTDDEFGCSGTIARLLDEGVDVHYAAFSICEESVPDGWPRDILATEVRAATAALGIRADQVNVFRYPVRHFPTHRQAILEDLVKLRHQIKPDLVLLPSLDDMHQDHEVIAREGLRAFKFASVLGYELPMNTITFQHACFVSLTEEQLGRKMTALMKYETQRFRSYVNEDFVRGLAKVRGVQAGVDYAEAFEVLRLNV
jgi:LmbE family N-acetylglucosaminyl deacetylase